MEPIYNQIAKEYKTARTLPYREHIEENTLLGLMPNLADKSILDLACGEGIYSRLARKKGAGLVVGVDISPQMIQLAILEESMSPLGIRYLVLDASELPQIHSFDYVMGAYLLHYAQNRSQLNGFCSSIARNISNQGEFVGLIMNPSNPVSNYSRYRKYGFEYFAPPERKEGDPIRVTFSNPDGTRFSFDNYYFSKETYEQIFEENGFSKIEWIRPSVSSKGKMDLGEEYWNEYIEQPPVIGIRARKIS